MTDMTTPTRTEVGNGSGRARVVNPSAVLSPVGRRNHARLGTGAIVVALSALAAVVLYTDVGHRQQVLAVARSVDPGQVIGDRDLKEVRVSADPGLHPIRARDRASVVGQVADVRLVPGTLLARGRSPPHPRLRPGQRSWAPS